MLRRLQGMAVLVAALALMLAVAPAAHATIVDSGSGSDSGEGSFDDCGFVIDDAATVSWRYWIRADGKEDSAQAFFGNVQIEHRAVFTNHETGDWFVIRGHFTLKDVKATLVEGDVYRFRQQQAGQPVVVEDSDGRVVLRDRGVVVWDQLFDTLGDNQPGGEELSAEVTGVHGPHPGLGLGDEGFCELATELIG